MWKFEIRGKAERDEDVPRGLKSWALFCEGWSHLTSWYWKVQHGEGGLYDASSLPFKISQGSIDNRLWG